MTPDLAPAGADPPTEAIATGAPGGSQDPGGEQRTCQLCEHPVADERLLCGACFERGQGNRERGVDDG